MTRIFIYVNFSRKDSGRLYGECVQHQQLLAPESHRRYLDIVKAEAAEANKAASANAEMKDFSAEIAQFVKRRC